MCCAFLLCVIGLIRYVYLRIMREGCCGVSLPPVARREFGATRIALVQLENTVAGSDVGAKGYLSERNRLNVFRFAFFTGGLFLALVEIYSTLHPSRVSFLPDMAGSLCRIDSARRPEIVVGDDTGAIRLLLARSEMPLSGQRPRRAHLVPAAPTTKLWDIVP